MKLEDKDLCDICRSSAMQKQKTILMLAITISTTIILLSTLIPSSAAYLKIFTPTKGQQVPAGSFLTITGTSTPSNATHTKCNVQLQTNQHGYKPVSPLGPAGTYTNWKGATSEPVKVGQNQVEGQFQCFAPNTTTPNFTKHLVRNFTGIQTNIGISGVPTVPH
jgi:hypothetical protein